MSHPIISIIFNAPPRVGKDTLARLIPEYLPGPVGQTCFKEALYDETFKRIAPGFRKFVPRSWWGSTAYDELKDDEFAMLALTDGFEGTARACLIHVAEDIIKPLHGDSYFGEQVAKSLILGINILTDGGFVPELEPIIETSDHVLVIQLERPGYSFDGDSRRYIKQEDFPDVTIIRRNLGHDQPKQSAEMLGHYLVQWINGLCRADERVCAMKQAIPAPCEDTFG